MSRSNDMNMRTAGFTFIPANGKNADCAESYAERVKVPTEQSEQKTERGGKPAAKPQSKPSKKQLALAAHQAQDAIHYRSMMEDGVCEIMPGTYSLSLAMADTDYSLLATEGKKGKFAAFCNLLNGTDTTTQLQLSVISHPITEREFRDHMAYRLPESEETLKASNEVLNSVLHKKILEDDSGSIISEKVLTITIPAPDLPTGRHLLFQQVKQYEKALRALHSTNHIMNGSERLQAFTRILRPDDSFVVDYKEMVRQQLHTKDFIAPTSFDFATVEVPDAKGNYRRSASVFRTGNYYGQVLTLHGVRGFGSDTSDDFIGAVQSLPFRTTISVFIQPMSQNWSINRIQGVLGSMDAFKADQIRKNAKDGVPPYLATTVGFNGDYAKADKLHTNLTEDNQKYMAVTVLVGTFADTPEEVLDQADQIRAAVEQFNFHLDSVDYESENALNSLLPIGANFTPFNRGLNTACTAMFIPFTSPELIHNGGLWYGTNEESGNPIWVNLAELTNGNGLVLGPPGVGKSMLIKLLIAQVRNRYPEDEIIIIDPEREYGYITQELGGEVIQIAPDRDNYINPFDINTNYGAENSNGGMYVKTGFILSLVQGALKHGLADEERSIVDRAARMVYEDYFKPSLKKRKMPTFKEFSEALNAMEGDVRSMAQRIKLALEIFTDGSMNIFSHETNVSLTKPITDLDLLELSGEQRKMGLSIALDLVWNRLTANRARKRRTWIFVEEYQTLMTDPYTAEFFKMVWSRARKYGGYPTAITQNIEMLLGTAEGRSMVSNSEFVVMLNQSRPDMVQLQNLLNLSDDQTEYIQNVPPGHGLLKASGSIIPFNAEWPEDNFLFSIMTTKPKEMMQYESEPHEPEQTAA